MTIYFLNQKDILKCPFAILVPEHYREDGSCKCDDAEHREMMIREWEYTPEHFKDIPLRVCHHGLHDCTLCKIEKFDALR